MPSKDNSKGFPGGSVVDSLPANAEDAGSIPGSERSPGEGNGNSLQSYCLESPMDRRVRWAIVHGIAKSRTRLSNFTGSLGAYQHYKYMCTYVCRFK